MKPLVLLAAVGLAAGTLIEAGQPAPMEDLLQRAREHSLALARGAAVIVAEEHSRQEGVRFNLPVRGRDAMPPGPTRLLRLITGDLILMRLPGPPGWLALPDVYEVDDDTVGERTDRVLNLALESPEATVAEAPFILDDAARHTIGTLPRVLSVPTLALAPLHPGYGGQFRLRPAGVERIEGRTARVFEFQETGRPTLIPGPDDTAFPLSGRISVDEAEGVVLKTVVRASASRLLSGTVTVFFERDARLEAWLPVRMQELYRQDGHPWNYRAETTYTNYRCYRPREYDPAEGPC